MDLGLTDKVVFVAGSSRGIGKGIAAVFLDEGARVILTGRDAATLKAAADELSESRVDQITTFAGDLTQAGVVGEAYRWAASHWGAIHILICNIGSGAAKSGWQLSMTEWERVFQINFWTTIRLVEAFLPSMVEARCGNIILISSIAGLESTGAPIPYATAKAAIERYAKDLARSVGKHGVRVNTVAPGNILFAGSSWERKLEVDAAGVSSMIAAEVPMGRFGTPAEIGAAVAFLASSRASFITGACLVADGGQTRA